jgi:DNA (cytosine-5)-methyltransferase 1
MQLCSPANTDKKGFSPFSEKASEKTMRKLQQYGTIANTPQGRELEKQFREQFANTLPDLSHEIALVTMEAQGAAIAFNSWHRNESIKAYGNAVVPQVVYQIFKAIQQYEDLNK